MIRLNYDKVLAIQNFGRSGSILIHGLLDNPQTNLSITSFTSNEYI